MLATMFIVKLSHEPADADVDDVGGALRHAVPVDEETLHCIVDSTVASLLRLPCPAFLNLDGLVASAETLLTNWSTTVDLMPQSAEAKAVAQASVAAAAECWASRDGVLQVLVHTTLMLDHAEFDPMPHRLKGDALRESPTMGPVFDEVFEMYTRAAQVIYPAEELAKLRELAAPVRLSISWLRRPR